MTDWIAAEHKYLMQTFKRLPIVLVRGEGVRVWDEEGRSYLDLVAGIATNVLGHCHPAVVEAVRQQVGTLIHTSNLYYTTPQIELGRLLVEHTSLDRAFFCNSGAEAVEGAVKLARKYGRLNKNGAFGVIAAERSFHGRTYATSALTGQPKYRGSWGLPLPEGFDIVPYNDLAALKAQTTDTTIAVLLEAVQGEGGIYPADREYMRGVRQWCDERGLLLIIDEVQAGMGRTGTFLAIEHYDVQPDIVTLAKGLAGGVPIGAILCREHVSVFEPGEHGTTFGGNPLATAAGVATVRTIFATGIIENAAQVGSYFLAQLRSLAARQPLVTEVRGVGLMLAFDMAQDAAARVVEVGLEHHVIFTNSGPGTIRIIPPLILTRADVDEAVTALDAILAQVANEVAAPSGV